MDVSRLMGEYFRDTCVFENHGLREALGRDIPIVVPNKKKWDLLDNPEALQRLFEFNDVTSLLYFLEDVIQLQEAMAHHGKILVDGSQVLIQVSTKTLNRVTDLDVEWSKRVDEIYEDIRSAEK